MIPVRPTRRASVSNVPNHVTDVQGRAKPRGLVAPASTSAHFQIAPFGPLLQLHFIPHYVRVHPQSLPSSSLDWHDMRRSRTSKPHPPSLSLQFYYPSRRVSRPSQSPGFDSCFRRYFFFISPFSNPTVLLPLSTSFHLIARRGGRTSGPRVVVGSQCERHASLCSPAALPGAIAASLSFRVVDITTPLSRSLRMPDSRFPSTPSQLQGLLTLTSSLLFIEGRSLLASRVARMVPVAEEAIQPQRPLGQPSH